MKMNTNVKEKFRNELNRLLIQREKAKGFYAVFLDTAIEEYKRVLSDDYYDF